MTCKYSKYFTKYQFNPEKNQLEEHFQQIETKLDYKTCRAYRQYFWFMFKIMIGFLIAMWSLVIGSGFGTNFEGEFIIGVACCIPLSIILVVVCLTLGINGYDLVLSREEVEEAYRYNSKYEVLQLHNKEQIAIMQEWRNNHPFQEKVRQALESKNGNDVAELIKMILEKETM